MSRRRRRTAAWPGQVIGQSDRTASQPTTEQYTPKHLLATVMNAVLDLSEVRLKPGLGRVANVLTEGEPIPGLRLQPDSNGGTGASNGIAAR